MCAIHMVGNLYLWNTIFLHFVLICLMLDASWSMNVLYVYSCFAVNVCVSYARKLTFKQNSVPTSLYLWSYFSIYFACFWSFDDFNAQGLSWTAHLLALAFHDDSELGKVMLTFFWKKLDSENVPFLICTKGKSHFDVSFLISEDEWCTEFTLGLI
jgi:hypothetical protein